MKVKYVTKMVAHGAGQTATFMPKPLFGEAGDGMHFHQHLFKEGRNVFCEADGALLYWWPAVAWTRRASLHQSFHQFLPAAGARL